jgi:hypothetical protein
MMKPNAELSKLPEADYRDYAYALVKGAISSIPIPFVPGIASEVFALLFNQPLSKRREEWMVAVAEGLVELKEKVEGFSLEALSENDAFVTTVLQATTCAMRNHQQDKLEALRNAVLNSALPNAPEDDVQLIFLDLVDTLTAWHLRVLQLFDDPVRWAEKNQRPFPKDWYTSGTRQVLDYAFPELTGKGELTGKIIQDLGRYGLAEIPGGMMTARGALESRTSNFGRQFLQFIATPRQLGGA